MEQSNQRLDDRCGSFSKESDFHVIQISTDLVILIQIQTYLT